ncbi:MAG: phospho-N-acetylmuramoyl-pentapeptide-transferase [Clostridia bacterium]|nr:phospho-N-acetylmuramoyl-pentapeptide-transferase [Clostridia bacterium]
MTGNMYALFIIVTLLVFGLSVLMLKYTIPVLKSKKVGQKILDIGPRWHKSKEGTPTMGGICFIIPTLAVSLGIFIYAYFSGESRNLIPFALTLLLGVMNALIGFVDDYTKLIKKQNQGLKAYQKFLLQVFAASFYILMMTVSGNMSTELFIPYFGVKIELGLLYYFFAIVLICGFVNSTNLTDGIDGLCSSVSVVVAAFFAVASFVLKDVSSALSSAVVIGGCLGFLVYNFHPAKIFMGDTGSLYLGGIFMGIAFTLDNPLIVVIAGFVFIFETVSVMLQVASFKLTGKRIFKMAPVHHHFERCGWGEIKIVSVFSAVSLLLCVAAWFGL